jgi:hypothetical protein
MSTLTPRGKALRWLTEHRGLTENPPGSNTDDRKDGIAAAQDRCAGGGTWLRRKPWCGAWCFNALHAAGVLHLGSWMASVSEVERRARAKTDCFRGWLSAGSINWKLVLRGDLVVLFGEGVHIATIRDCSWRVRLRGYIVTDEGNTSPGDGGSQANGGGSFCRKRRLSDIHGIALVNYPG